FEDGAVGAGAACGMDAVATLEDCQTEPAAMPMQSVIGNAIASKVRLLSDGHVIGNRSPSCRPQRSCRLESRVAPSHALVWRAENPDRVELSVELIGAFADSGPSRTVIPTDRGQRSGDSGQFPLSV